MRTLCQDRCYCIQTQLKSPALTVTKVATAALGIGVHGTTFTVINLPIGRSRWPPYPDREQEYLISRTKLLSKIPRLTRLAVTVLQRLGR